MTEWCNDQEIELNPETMEKAHAIYKQACNEQSGIVVSSIGESPLMQFIEWEAGVANAHFLLFDHADKAEALFEAELQLLQKKAKLMATYQPADGFHMVENTSTTLISPDQYERYCLPHLQQVQHILGTDNRRLILHMCGKIKQLLPLIHQVGENAFEAFTTPDVGDTHLSDGRRACPETCIIGGTNAALWLCPVDEIIAGIEEELSDLHHYRGLVITSASEMPPLASPDTIKQVADAVRSFKV